MCYLIFLNFSFLCRKMSKIKLSLKFLLTHTFSNIFLSPSKIMPLQKKWSLSKYIVNIKLAYFFSKLLGKIKCLHHPLMPVTQSCCFQWSLLNIDSLSWSLASSVKHTRSELAGITSHDCDSFRNEKCSHPETAPFSFWQNS